MLIAVAGISARFSKFAFVLFCYITNHLMTGPLGNSEFCFPRISMFPSTSSRETLRFSGNKIHCSPRDQSLSVKCNVCVNNIVLFVTMSRHAIHHDNIYSFQPLHLNFVLYIVLEKIHRGNGPKKEVANVSRYYVPNLGTGHNLCGWVRGGGVRGGGESWSGSGLFYFRKKGWAKRDFHDGWGWVIVCFVKTTLTTIHVKDLNKF